jgi:predicted transcriptional regulator
LFGIPSIAIDSQTERDQVRAQVAQDAREIAKVTARSQALGTETEELTRKHRELEQKYDDLERENRATQATLDDTMQQLEVCVPAPLGLFFLSGCIMELRG